MHEGLGHRGLVLHLNGVRVFHHRLLDSLSLCDGLGLDLKFSNFIKICTDMILKKEI